MAVNQKIAEALKRISFEHREADYHHHTYDEDMFQYELIRNGDMKAAEIGIPVSEYIRRMRIDTAKTLLHILTSSPSASKTALSPLIPLWRIWPKSTEKPRRNRRLAGGSFFISGIPVRYIQRGAGCR